MRECLERTPFFTSTYLHIATQPHFTDQGYLLVVPLDRLLGDSRYKESLSGLTRALELSLGETVKGSDVTAVERDLLLRFRDARLFEPSTSRAPDSWVL